MCMQAAKQLKEFANTFHLSIDSACSSSTGYLTSRPASRGWIREASTYLQAARQLEAFTKTPGKTAQEANKADNSDNNM